VLPVATPLLGLLPKLPVPGLNTLNVLFFSVFFSYALTNVLRRGSVMRSGRLLVPLGILVGICALSIVRGASFPTGMRYEAGAAGFALFRSAMSFLAYLICLSMARGARDRRWMTWAILAGFAAETGFTFLYGRNLHGRATGTIGQANELGTYLAMFSVFALAMGFGVRNWAGRLLLWGLAVAGSVGVFMSVSRGALVAVAAGAIMVSARTSRLLLVLVVLALGTSPLWVPDYVKERVLSTVSESDDSDDTQLEAGTESRLNTWESILRIVEEHPLDGIGFAGLAEVLPSIGEELGLRVKDSSHNTFLRLLAETGVAGLAAFLFVLWVCLQLSFKGARLAASRFDRQIAVGLGGMLVAFALSCWFGDRFFEVMIAGNFWVACALVEDAIQERTAVPPRVPAPAPRGARVGLAP
jgi:O-antigen ligase